MSRLEELIQELCPDGVEYKRLEDCCYLQKGTTPIQKAIPGKYPLVVTTDERKSSNTYQFNAPTVCIPLVSSRGHGVACLNQVYYQEGKFALGNILCGVTPKDNSKLSASFLYHYLNYKKDTLIVPLMKGGANVSLTVDSLKRVKIPVPPLEVQLEIICILDKFIALSTELRAELAARKKQYEYYRDKLLSFDVHGGGQLKLNGGHCAISSKAAVPVVPPQKETAIIMKTVIFLGLGHRMFTLMKFLKLIYSSQKRRLKRHPQNGFRKIVL